MARVGPAAEPSSTLSASTITLLIIVAVVVFIVGAVAFVKIQLNYQRKKNKMKMLARTKWNYRHSDGMYEERFVQGGEATGRTHWHLPEGEEEKIPTQIELETWHGRKRSDGGIEMRAPTQLPIPATVVSPSEF